MIGIYSVLEDPADYEQLTSTVTFSSSDSIGNIKCITFDLKPDALLEGDETFTVTIRNDIEFNIGEISQATVTIQDGERTYPHISNT